MNDTEKPQDNNDITVIISDYEEPYFWRHSGDKPERPRLPISAKRIALRNLLFELAVLVPFILLMAWGGDDGSAVIICELFFACIHTAISAGSFKQCYRKNGVSAWKFLVLNTLPLPLVSAFTYAVGALMANVFDVFDLGLIMAFWFLSVGFLLYSIMYCVFLLAALGIIHALSHHTKYY